MLGVLWRFRAGPCQAGPCKRAGMALCLITAPCAVLLSARPAHAEDPKPTVAFTVSDPRITEASGLVVSRRHPGIVYTHNDSGDSARIFAIGPNGRTRATFTLAGANARDWEGMALGRDDAGRPALFVADIGDNLGGAWPYVTVYRVPEPARVRDQTLRATTFRLRYADGARNAESILINPSTNRLYIASKLLNGALYAAPKRLRASGYNVLREVGNAPPIATDGAFAPDGRSFAIRTYYGASVYAMSAGRPGRLLRVVSLPDQDQGESIAYSLDGRSLLAGSEGNGEPIWKVPLPADALPSPTPSAAKPGSAPGPSTTPSGQEHQRKGGAVLGLLAVAGLATVGAALVVRRRV